MAVYEKLFPAEISYGATGGPEWSTNIGTSFGGAEYRQANWTFAMHKYDVAHGVKTQTQLNNLRAFFNMCRGKAHSFRYKDWADFTVDVGEGVFVSLTATTFQMYKRYTFDGVNYDRKITKIASSGATVTGGAGVSVNLDTGVVTVSSGTPTSWVCDEFHVPCRFDTDIMRINIVDYNIYEWGQIPIVEIR